MLVGFAVQYNLSAAPTFIFTDTVMTFWSAPFKEMVLEAEEQIGNNITGKWREDVELVEKFINDKVDKYWDSFYSALLETIQGFTAEGDYKKKILESARAAIGNIRKSALNIIGLDTREPIGLHPRYTNFIKCPGSGRKENTIKSKIEHITNSEDYNVNIQGGEVEEPVKITSTVCFVNDNYKKRYEDDQEFTKII